MAAYNEEKWIGKTIDSVLSQTFPYFEFIIINDGSRDKTQQIIESYKDSRIRVLVNTSNMGLARSLNRGIRSAKGEYIARIDAGDIMLPKRLQEQVNFLWGFPKVFIVGTWATQINSEGKEIGRWKVPIKTSNSRLFLPQIAIHPTIMVRKSLFDCGYYNERFDISLEYELFLRARQRGFEIANIPKYLTEVLVRQGMTNSNLRKTQYNQLEIKLHYLPYFFSFWNVYSTLRSLVGLVIPTPVLKTIISRRLLMEA